MECNKKDVALNHAMSRARPIMFFDLSFSYATCRALKPAAKAKVKAAPKRSAAKNPEEEDGNQGGASKKRPAVLLHGALKGKSSSRSFERQIFFTELKGKSSSRSFKKQSSSRSFKRPKKQLPRSPRSESIFDIKISIYVGVGSDA